MRLSLNSKVKKTNKKGVFGLTSIQAFFAIILGIALLAYVIIVIMGTLSDSTILTPSTLSATVANESGWINTTTYSLATKTTPGFASPTIVLILNASDNATIGSGNYSLSTAGVLTNASPVAWNTVKITYTYKYNDNSVNNANRILGNTSEGITNFFGNISPVYAILAILVIILVLVVLVRVVSGGGAGRSSQPQL